jgi:hypothetical protein
MANDINKEVLDQLLVEVTGEIAEYLRKDEADLRKAAGDDDDASGADDSEGSSGPSDPVDSGAPEASAAPAGPPEGAAPEGSPDQGPPMDDGMGQDPMAGQDPGQQAIEPAPSVEGLQAEYMKLDPEALKMHYLACKEALMAQMGAGPEASAPMAPPGAAPGPEASATAGPPPPPEASAPAFKGELSAGKQLSTSEEANGGAVSKGASLGKSQKDFEIEALKQQLAKNENDLKKQEEELLKLAMRLTAPLRKSYRSLSELQYVDKEGSTEKKSPVEGLSKNEIVTKLRVKARDEQLNKSDRDLINQYTCGVVDVSKIEHLLVK